MKLHELKIGQSGTITAVGGAGALRCRLLDMGLIPKTKVKLIKIAPMGDPIEIRLRGYELTLRRDDAAHIALTQVHDMHDLPQGRERLEAAVHPAIGEKYAPRAAGTLQENMIVTVEPGLYIEGKYGVRIEDSVAVTADGCEILTKTSKELMELL